jgi:hypothetical protein
MYWYRSADVRVYRTKKGFHFYVNMTVKHNFVDKGLVYRARRLEIIFYQLILGSDWLRELRNYDRAIIHNERDNWNILFSEKDKNGKMQYEKFYCAYRILGSK